MEYVTNIKIFKTGFSFIISQTGVFIEYKDKDYIMDESIFSVAKKDNSPQLEAIGEKMIKGLQGFEKYFSKSLNVKYYITYAPLESTGWSMGIVIPVNELLSELNAITLKLFVMGLVGYILALGIIIFLAKKLTMPLRYLANATNKIGEGNFDGNIPKIMPLRGSM